MNVDFSGVWKANLEKSNILGARPKAMMVKIDHSNPELLAEMVITQLNEIEDLLIFRGLTSREEVTNFIGSLQVRSRSRWMGAELLIESWMNHGGREGHFRDYWSLSSDRGTLKMEHRDDDLAGQITLLERVIVAI